MLAALSLWGKFMEIYPGEGTGKAIGFPNRAAS